MVQMAMFNVQRTLVTPNVGKPEFLLMCSACCLIVLYICVKCCENISNCIYCYGVDTNDRSAGGWTDTQNFGGYNIILSLLFVMGHNVYGLRVGF